MVLLKNIVQIYNCFSEHYVMVLNLKHVPYFQVLAPTSTKPFIVKLASLHLVPRKFSVF